MSRSVLDMSMSLDGFIASGAVVAGRRTAEQVATHLRYRIVRRGT